MPSIVLLALILLVGFPLLPVYILRGGIYLRAREYFVASEPTPPGVVQNSSIAYSLQVATFGHLFGWGAAGDFWPAIALAAMFGAGLYLIYALRRPMLAFLKRALAQDRSITISRFVAQQHGDDSRVRLFAAALTVVPFMGLVSAEAIGVAALVNTVFQGGPIAQFAIACGLLALMAVYTIPDGNTGAMRSAQAQLGILYFGLFGSILLTLYLLISSARPMPPHGTFAVAVLAACCVVVLVYRRSRYIDTSPIGRSAAGGTHAEQFSARLFRRISRLLNELIWVLAATTLVFALMGLYAEDFSSVVANSVSALQTATRTSIPTLIGLALLALFYPMVDMTNWLRIAAVEPDPHSAQFDPAPAFPFARIIRMYAGGSAIVWLIICMFGTIAVLATGTATEGDILKSFVTRLASQQNEMADLALWLLLVSLFAMAVTTMSAMFSASLAVIRYDIVPSIWQGLESEHVKPSDQARARRRAIIAAGALCVTMLVVLTVLTGNSDVNFTSDRFLGLQLACLCAQLACVPLVLGPLIGGTSGNSAAVSPPWAIAVLSVGVASGVGAVIVCLQTGYEAWLWTAVPSCLGSGLLLFAVARLWTCKTARA